MLKKLASLLLSLLLCLSLLPGQTRAADEPAPPADPPAIAEPEEPEEPPVMPAAVEVPGEKEVDNTGKD